MIRRLREAWDPWMAAVLAGLAALGLATLYSAVHFGDTGLVRRQALFWLLGVLAWCAGALVPLRFWARIAWPAYAAALVLLVATLAFGEVRMGARRWLDLGLFSLQASEPAKWAMLLVLAHWLADREPRDARTVLVAVALALAPALLVAAQPDLGTALIMLGLAGWLLLVAGLGWRWLAAGIALAAASAPLLWRHALHDYQRARVLTFLHPERDPQGAGYHVLQSKIAIGSGGVLGKGWLHGDQARLHFLPEQHTDFIFAVLAEEGGLLAALVLLALYAMLVGRLLGIAARAPTRFGALVAAGAAGVFTLYAFVNMAMTSGMLPVVGVPLPLVSYGGSSLTTLLFLLGVCARVRADARHAIPWQRPANPYAG